MNLFPTRKEASKTLENLIERHPFSEEERKDAIQIRMCLEQEEQGTDLWGTEVEEARPLFFPPAKELPEKEKEKNDRAYRRALRIRKRRSQNG